MTRAVLVTLGTYVLCLGLSFVYLIAGAALTGKSISAGERGVVFVMGATIFTFLIGAVVTFLAMGKGAGTGAKVGLSLGYCSISLVTVIVFGFITLIVFNR
jgi:hypothetical protein